VCAHLKENALPFPVGRFLPFVVPCQLLQTFSKFYINGNKGLYDKLTTRSEFQSIISER
jgi:hypothetical protein